MCIIWKKWKQVVDGGELCQAQVMLFYPASSHSTLKLFMIYEMVSSPLFRDHTKNIELGQVEHSLMRSPSDYKKLRSYQVVFQLKENKIVFNLNKFWSYLMWYFSSRFTRINLIELFDTLTGGQVPWAVGWVAQATILKIKINHGPHPF